MAGLLASDEYAHAARSQAAGYQALFHELAGQPQATPLQAEKTGAALLVVGKVRQ
jgi:nucleotide-binding universal stress UspA family protein